MGGLGPAESFLGMEKDERSLELSLIRVCDATGNTRGTGFLISDSMAVTCAHVVTACGTAPGGRYMIRIVLNRLRQERRW
jgi:hypothetical protein